MQLPNQHKVCIPLEGRPVIARAIETYRRCGIGSHFVVVGSMADQVMEAASSAPGDLFFAYQAEPRGTGHAARTAARLLQAMDYTGDVLVVAGDKVIEDEILTELIQTFYRTDCDLAFVVGDARDFPSSGRVIYDGDASPRGIVEVFDIGRIQLLRALKEMTAERIVPACEVEELALRHLRQEKKAALALGHIWDVIKAGEPLTREMMDQNFSESDYSFILNGSEVPPGQLVEARHANLSVYLFRAPALYEALKHLTSDNAQQEEYLTDTIGILASLGRKLVTVPVAYPEQVMAFNTPEELRAIEEYMESRSRVTVTEKPRSTRLASEWLNSFEAADLDSVRYLSGIYGEGHPQVEAKRRTLISLLKEYISEFGDGETIIARAPGRVNIMGRHVDHQGGHGNMIAIDHDILAVIGGRADRQVHLRSLEPHQFPARSFDIDELMSGYRSQGWLDFVDSQAVRDRVAAAHGDWAQYVRAPIVRFQAEFMGRPLKGMNIAVSGDIPIAAGLSSSSALVVAVAEGIAALNEIRVRPEEFVELCGEGEWYVGTRGGAGDHAAMKFARRGQVVQVGFFPFGVTDTVDFPRGHMFVVCNSHEKARKTAGARDTFNQRVACYHIGREILKRECPECGTSVEHLRDVNVRHLGVEYVELLRMLKKLPVAIRREEIASRITAEKAEQYLRTHSESFDNYSIRAIVIYGLAECERSRSCPDLLRAGDIARFGRWMNISHDGDRVVTWDSEGTSRPFTLDYSDAAMDRLIASASDDASSLAAQPGRYECSTPRIDRMADIALSVNGVLGAQILGAGLGGCLLVLAEEDSREALERAMVRNYYEPLNLEPDMFACYPVAGSGVVSF